MSPTSILLLAALAGAPAVQEGEPRASSPAASPVAGDAPWRLVNQVQIIANEDIVTLRQIEARVRRVLARYPVSTQEELDALSGEIARAEVENLLMIQRGRDFGFDPEIVQRMATQHMEGQAERAGGVSELAERLSLRGETAAQARQTVTDELYAQSYERAIMGKASGPRGRPIRDRYVRPGNLALVYESLQHQPPQGIEALGGQPETYVLQQIVLAVRAFPSHEEAREHAAGLREEALSGADFDMLVREFSYAPEERGLTRPMSPAELRLVDPRIARFCAENEVGAISEVFSVIENERPVAVRVMRIHEHQPLELPPFGAASVQEKLRELMLEYQDAMLRERALRELFQSSYIWTSASIRPAEPRRPSQLAPRREDAPAEGDEPEERASRGEAAGP